MSEKLKVRTGPTVPPLKLYLIGIGNAPKPEPIDPKKRPGSQEQRKAEVKYKEQLSKSERRLGKLQVLDVVPPQLGMLSTSIVQAKDFAVKQDFLSALSTLTAVDSTKLKKQGRAVAKKQVKNAEKQFDAQMKLGQAINATLDKQSETLMSASETTEFRNTVKATLQPLYQPKATEAEGVDATEELTLVRDKIQSRIDAFKIIKVSAEKSQQTAQEQLKAITGKLPPETLAPLLERLQGIGTLMAEHEWERAETAATLIAGDIKTEFDKVQKSEETGKAIGELDNLIDTLETDLWKNRQKDLPALNKRLVEAAKAGETLNKDPATKGLYVPFPDPAIGGIATTFKTLGENKAALVLGTGKGLTPEKALEALSGAENRLEQVEARIKLVGNPNFAKIAKVAQDRIAKASSVVDDALATLRDALDSLGVDPDPVCKPLAEEREMIVKHFTTGMQAASDPAKIDPKETVASLISLAARTNRLAEDDRGLDTIVTKTQTDGAREAFTAELKRAQEALDVLVVMDPLIAEKLLGELRKLESEGARAKLPAIYEALADKAGDIARRAGEKADTTGDWITGAREQLEQSLAIAKPLVEQFAKEVEKKRKVLWVEGSNQEKKYGELRDFFNNTLQEQMAAQQVDSLTLLGAAAKAAKKLGIDAKDALDDLHGDKPVGSKSTTLDTHAKQLADIKAGCGSGSIATFGGDTAKVLIARCAELEKEVPKMPLQDGRLAIVTVTTEYKALLDKAGKAKKDYNLWRKRIGVVEKKLKLLGDDAENFKKYMAEQLKVCKESAKKEDGLEAARTSLNLIEQQIADVMDDPAVRGDAEQTATDIREKKKDDEKVWEKTYESAVKRAKEVTGMLTKNRSEVITLMTQANTLFKQTGDFDLAITQLDVALARVDYVEKNPEGVGVTQRKKLPAVQKKWRDKLDGMKAAFDTLLQDHVLTLDAAAVPDDVKNAVKGAIAEAGALFNPAEFDATVKTMIDPHRSTKEKLAERERALRRIETILAQFEANPLLRQLEQNPWAKNEVHAGIASSRFALLDMQNNLLGCMPKNTYD